MPTARIFQINASAGGVPKLPIPRAEITADGLVEDRQDDLKHHGGPDRALCLYSLQRILDLQAEGHPIFPGAAGENLTVSGLDWNAMQPSLTLRLGRDALVEIVSYTAPCWKIRSFFADGNPGRISQDEHPGWSRLYARVLRPGSIVVGDPVEFA